MNNESAIWIEFVPSEIGNASLKTLIYLLNGSL